MRKTVNSISGLALAALFAVGTSGCKGRTNDNVEPTGDTIEVVINEPDTAVANYDDQAVTLPDAVEVPD